MDITHRKRLVFLFLTITHAINKINCNDETAPKYDMTNLGTEHLLRGSTADDRGTITAEDIAKLQSNFDTSKKDEAIDAVTDGYNETTSIETQEEVTSSQSQYETTTEEINTGGEVSEETTDATDVIEDDNQSGEKRDASERSEVTEEEHVTATSRGGDTATFSDVRDETTTASNTAPTDTEAVSNETEGASEIAAGLRNPKTDNSATPEPIDGRTFEAKPRPHAAVSRSSTLRAWLEDSWLRTPPALLVPLRPNALQRALAVWNDLVEDEGIHISDIVIIGYDSNGVSWRSRHNLQDSSHGKEAVTDALSKLLLKYEGVFAPEMAGDGAMRALATAAKMVPYDSAIFVITDRGAADTQRLPLALKALVEKRLKVYTIWTDPYYPSAESEASLQHMRNVSAHTEGDVLPYAFSQQQAETLEEEELPTGRRPQGRSARLNTYMYEGMETLLVRRGGGDALSLGLPVEAGVTALRVYIEGSVEHAVLYPPNDAPQIDLYNKTSIEAFSTESRVAGLAPRDVYLAFPGAAFADKLSVLPMEKLGMEEPEPNTGTWHLSVICDKCDFRITVTAQARIHFDATLVNDDTLNLSVTGPLSTVRESTLIDEYGNELHKLPFSYQPTAALGEDSILPSPEQHLSESVSYPQLAVHRVYAKITGRDLKGESYVRLAGPIHSTKPARVVRSAAYAYSETNADVEVNQDLDRSDDFSSRVYDKRFPDNFTGITSGNRASSQITNQYGTILTAVQIGLSSRLYGAAGDNLQLHYEVTNYREQSVFFKFEAVGELRFLRSITPAQQTIAAGQTVNVIVSATIPSGTLAGARDFITFTAYVIPGYEQVSLSSYVYVTDASTTSADVSPPTLTHSFQSGCWARGGDECARYTWTATVTARDTGAGLLRLSSMPLGLIYDSNFVSGTRESVTATYRASCCNTRVVFSAVDAYGNANSYVADVATYIAPAGIAAIVLGVFLLIALIALLVFLIVWCVRRRRESAELPSYSSSRATRREVS